MYIMFVLTATGGLIATAQLTPIAKDFGIADIPVSLVGLTGAALPFALSLNRILNGVSRPAFGWVSDHIGRENTMFVAFALEGIAILLLGEFGHDPLAFVLLTALTFFAYGEIYRSSPRRAATSTAASSPRRTRGSCTPARGWPRFSSR